MKLPGRKMGVGLAGGIQQAGATARGRCWFPLDNGQVLGLSPRDAMTLFLTAAEALDMDTGTRDAAYYAWLDRLEENGERNW